jgi:hypothetical protein
LPYFYPSANRSKKVPILDLEVWIVRTDKGYQEILYQFYEKPMKSMYVLMKRSAVASNTKRSALVQEVVRRLRNCHANVPEEIVAEILSNFSQKMYNSEYSEKFRREVIEAGIKIHKKQVVDNKNGTKVMYKPRELNRAARKKAKKQNNWNWWKKPDKKRGKPISIMKVPFTYDSKLKKLFEKKTSEHNIFIKFIETSGHSLQNLLEQPNPFKEPTCGRENCFPCKQRHGGKCEKRGAGYVITCEEGDCKEKVVEYNGESGKNGFSRGVEHLDDYKRREADHPMWKHSSVDHNSDTNTKFKMKVIKTFGADNMKRKVDEALRITRNPGQNLNSKAEFRQPSLPRIVIVENRNVSV